MIKNDKLVNFNVNHVIIDFLVIISVYGAAYFLTPAWKNIDYRFFYGIMLLSFTITFFLFMAFFRMYSMSTFFRPKSVLRNTTLSLVFTTATMFVALFSVYSTGFSRLFLLVFLSVTFILLNTEKIILLKVRKATTFNTKAIYVGNMSEKKGKGLYEDFVHLTPLSGFNFTILGYIDTSGAETKAEGCLGDIKDFEMILRHNPCGNVIFAISIMEAQRFDIEQLLRISSEMGITSRVIFDSYQFENYHWYVSSLGAYPMLTYDNVSLDPISQVLKRSMDIVGGITGVILSLPILIITAIAIKLNSPGPVIFKQLRVGLHGEKFHIYKFRSMYINAEQQLKDLMAKNEMGDSRVFKMKDDPRITKIGKFIRKTSIDELPQFFNVIIGNMSLVGTRPPTVNEVEQYDRHHFMRISIKPGITGMWQTSGRNKITDFEQIVKLDVAYIENWSLILDIKLILKTIKVLFDRTGAY